MFNRSIELIKLVSFYVQKIQPLNFYYLYFCVVYFNRLKFYTKKHYKMALLDFEKNMSSNGNTNEALNVSILKENLIV